MGLKFSRVVLFGSFQVKVFENTLQRSITDFFTFLNLINIKVHLNLVFLVTTYFLWPDIVVQVNPSIRSKFCPGLDWERLMSRTPIAVQGAGVIHRWPQQRTPSFGHYGQPQIGKVCTTTSFNVSQVKEKR